MAVCACMRVRAQTGSLGVCRGTRVMAVCMCARVHIHAQMGSLSVHAERAHESRDIVLRSFLAPDTSEKTGHVFPCRLMTLVATVDRLLLVKKLEMTPARAPSSRRPAR